MSLDPGKGVLPNFFVVGAPRSGTTLLDRALRQHREVFMCPIKEPNYFAKDVDSSGYLTQNGFPDVEVSELSASALSDNLHFAAVKNFDDYAALFKGSNGAKAIGECSTSYMLSERAAEEIHDAVPHARIIAILRDPVMRAHSHYRMLVAQGFVHGTLAEAVDKESKQSERWPGIIQSSLYLHQIERFLSRFGPSQVLVGLSEDLHDWPKFSRTLAKFLKIDAGLFPAAAPRVNESRSPRFPVLNYWSRQLGVLSALRPILPRSMRQSFSKMYFREGRDETLAEADRSYLAAVFEPEITQLGSLIGRDLSHWLQAGKVGSQASLAGC